MRAPRDPSGSGLWLFDLHNLAGSTSPSDSISTPTPASRRALSASIHTQTIAERVRFVSMAFGAPADATLAKAADLGFLRSIPGFQDGSIVRRHPPHLFETAVGHMDNTRSNVRSSRPVSVAESDCHFPAEHSSAASGHVSITVVPTGGHALDTTAALPAPSNKISYHVVMFSHDGNYIHVELSPSRHATDLGDAVLRGLQFFTQRGLKPLHEVLDNEFSHALEDAFRLRDITFQLVPPHSHRCNPAERAIRTWKGHFESTLACADPTFPLEQQPCEGPRGAEPPACLPPGPPTVGLVPAPWPLQLRGHPASSARYACRSACDARRARIMGPPRSRRFLHRAFLPALPYLPRLAASHPGYAVCQHVRLVPATHIHARVIPSRGTRRRHQGSAARARARFRGRA
jgi:hypothetical protein